MKPVLRFNFKIFGQKCFTCKWWGSGSVIEGDLFNLTLIYGNIIEIMKHRTAENLHLPFELESYEKNGIAPRVEGGRKDIRMEGRIIGHKTDLCEACHLGMCIGFFLMPDREIRMNEDESDE